VGSSVVQAPSTACDFATIMPKLGGCLHNGVVHLSVVNLTCRFSQPESWKRSCSAGVDVRIGELAQSSSTKFDLHIEYFGQWTDYGTSLQARSQSDGAMAK